MGKYTSYDDFKENAPNNWKNETTADKYLKGLKRIAPPDAKESVMNARAKAYEDNTDEKGAKKWFENYTLAVFGVKKTLE